MELAKIHGPYDSYRGSNVSKGILHYEFYNIKDDQLNCDWTTL